MNNTVNFQVNIAGNALVNLGKLHGGLNQLVSVTGDVDKSVNNTFNDLKGKIASINLSAIITQFKAVAEGISMMSAPGIEFGQGMADLSSITGIVGKDLDYLSKMARKTGKESGIEAKGAAEAYAILASQIEVDEIGMEGLIELQKKAITLSQASGMEMTGAAEALAGTVNQFGFGADQAGRVINVLAAGSKYGAAEIDDLSQSFKVVGSQSAIAGVSLEETAGALEILSKNNIKGSEAGTDLRNIILSLQTVFGADLKNMTLTEALDQLKPKLGDSKFMVESFGRASMGSAQFLIQNAEAIGEMTDKLTGTDTALEQASVRTDTVAQMMAKCRAWVDNFKIGLFNLTGPIGGVTALLAEQATGFVQLLPGMYQLYKLLKKVAWAKKLNAFWTGMCSGATKIATIVMGALNTTMLGCPVWLIIAGVAALVTGIVIAWNKFEGFRKVIFGVWECLKEFGKAIFNSVLDPIKHLLSGIGSIGSAIAKLFNRDFKGAWQDAKSGALDLGKAALSANPVVGVVKAVVKTDWGGAWERGKQKGADSWAASQSEKEAEKETPGAIPSFDMPVDMSSLEGIMPSSGLKLNLDGRKGRKGAKEAGSGSGHSSTGTGTLDLNKIVPDLKGSTAYSAIASRLATFRTSAITAAASVAMPLTVAATTLPTQTQNPLDAASTEYLADNNRKGVSMGKFCDTVEIHIASADGKGYKKIETEVIGTLKKVFDDYGA